jgi:hypothetical protein
MQKIIIVLALYIFVTSCGPSTRITSSWRDPAVTFEPKQDDKILVIALVKDETTRRTVEDQLVARMQGRGVASYSYLIDKKLDSTTITTELKNDGFDAAIVVRLVNVDKETRYVPGTTYPGYYGGFGGYYGHAYGMYGSPGYYTTDKNFYVETNVYSLETGKLMWAGITETTNPDKTNKMINEIADAVSAKMKSEKFLIPAK